jgi:hypothetical protein
VRLLIVALLGLAPTTAFAGQFCTDACTPDPNTGQACSDFGLGCNAISNQCVVCTLDDHCQPGGTCSNGSCMGLVCTPDAGADDATPDAMNDAEPDAAVDANADAEPDATPGMDAEPMDADAVDMAFPDARDPNEMLPGTRPPPNSKTDTFEEDDCKCTSTRHSEASALWMLIALGLIVRYRKC